ncbi:MAG TPA: 2-amino-4-hydroxy-6-hydroxymethyldihydropteridine diphosphokinase [Vicinamibacterales bacterium]|nr:2-amino-4-hydroxy-6-hydroxymethyldihydropteridine diphosphokinase [Vicinamibacterales bacterium]
MSETSRKGSGPDGPPSIRVAIALGSNLGDREANLAFGLSALPGFITSLKQSTWHDTEPFGVSPDQPRYLNGVVIGETELTARELLDRLLAIEQEAGRKRPSAMAPRTLDLDLILYGDKKIEEPGLAVPHPRFRERRFVLEPLAEVAPDWIDPATGRSIRELLSALLQQGPRALPGPS